MKDGNFAVAQSGGPTAAINATLCGVIEGAFASDKNIFGAVASLIEVPSKYENAIEMILGASLQNVVTESEEDAKRAIALLKKDNAGRATFLPVNTIKGRKLEEKGLNDAYGFIGIASDLCSCDAEYDGI